MNYEIVTHPITTAQIEKELEHFVEYFQTLGIAECEAYFGAAWCIDYYVDAPKERRLSLASLLAEVRRAASLGWGGLGSNDLYVTVPGVSAEFRFCNDSDVHISFKQSGEVTEYFYQRWRELGYHPAEWKKTDCGRNSKRLRRD